MQPLVLPSCYIHVFTVEHSLKSILHYIFFILFHFNSLFNPEKQPLQLLVHRITPPDAEFLNVIGTKVVSSQSKFTVTNSQITTACPVCLTMGANKVKNRAARKIIICTGLTRAAKAGHKSIVLARQAQQNSQGRTPVICIPRVPICRSFNSQQGPPLSGLSGC